MWKLYVCDVWLLMLCISRKGHHQAGSISNMLNSLISLLLSWLVVDSQCILPIHHQPTNLLLNGCTFFVIDHISVDGQG